MDALREKGYAIAVDWKAKEHTDKSKVEQWKAVFQTGIKADAVFISFEAMEERTHAAAQHCGGDKQERGRV